MICKNFGSCSVEKNIPDNNIEITAVKKLIGFPLLKSTINDADINPIPINGRVLKIIKAKILK